MKILEVNGKSDLDRGLREFVLSCISDDYEGCRPWPYDRRDETGKHVRQRVTSGKKYENGRPMYVYAKAFICEAVHGPNDAHGLKQAGSSCGNMSCYSRHCLNWMWQEDKARGYNTYRKEHGNLPPVSSPKFSEKYRSSTATE